MVKNSVLLFSLFTLLLLGTSIAVPGALATKDPREIDTHPPIHIKRFSGTSPTGYGPQTIWASYGFTALSCTHTTSTDWTDPKLCGHGQTIAIVDAYDDPNIASDLQVFDSQFGLPACPAGSCFVKLEPQGSPTSNSGWALEESLDVEWAHSVAPGAKIILVEAKNSYLSSLLSAVDTGVGQGAQQLSMSWGGSEFSSESSYDFHFNSGTTSFFASSGDSGSGVEYPAASPYVVSVGGTTLQVDSSGNYLSETAWSGSGGGVSAYEPKPSYQNNFSPYNSRAVPDVAYDADPSTGVAVYDSVPYNGQSGWFEVGGTSAGAPQWAAVSAVANSYGAKLSSASFGTSSALYGAAQGAEATPQTSPYTGTYHDVVTGSNGNCGSVCNAGAGYDAVTGLGSAQSNNLIPYLSPVPTPDFAISASPSSLTVASGGSSSSTITVSSVNGFAGTVTLSVSPTGGATLASTSLLVSSGGTNSTTLVVNPTSSTTYAVAGSSGSISHSTSVSVTVDTAPSAPQALQATAGSQQVSLSWQAPSSTGGLSISYSVFRNGTQVASGISGTAYSDTGLTNGDAQSYYVEAVNSVGSSGPSNTVSATPVSTPSLSVLVTTDKPSYPRGATAHVTVTVTSGSSPVSGAAVVLKVTAPNGSTTSASGTTNSSGQVVFSFHVPKHAKAGTYTASASASDTGYLPGSGSVTFQVT